MHTVYTARYAGAMERRVSVRELRNSTAEVVAAVRAGDLVSLTVNGAAVADIVPHGMRRSPWVPAARLEALVAEAGADPGLMDDIAFVREEEIGDDEAGDR